MAMRANDSKLSEIVELISEQGFSGMAEAVQVLLNEAMLVERTRHLQAQPYERSPLRQDYANGFKAKRLKTQLGELLLNVPQVRDGNFYPSFLDKGIRSERALRLALAEMYVQGVSTRKVNAVLQELCGLEISSTEVSRAAKLLDEELLSWKKRALDKYPVKPPFLGQLISRIIKSVACFASAPPSCLRQTELVINFLETDEVDLGYKVSTTAV